MRITTLCLLVGLSGCGIATEVSIQRSSGQSSTDSASENTNSSSGANLVSNTSPDFPGPTSVYATGLFRAGNRLDPYLNSGSSLVPTYVVLSAAGAKSVNLKGAIAASFESNVQAYNAAGQLVQQQDLVDRKVFMTGVWNPDLATVTKVKWIQEVPNSVGGCSFESDIMRTRATGCQLVAAPAVPPLVTFFTDELKTYAAQLNPQTFNQFTAPGTGTLNSPAIEITRFVSTKTVYPSFGSFAGVDCTGVVNGNFTPTCPFLPLDNIQASCQQLGPGFRLPRVSEMAQIANLGSFKQIFAPFQTVVDATQGAPNIGVYALSAQNIPVRYNLKTQVINDRSNTYAYMFCAFGGDQTREMTGQFKKQSGSMSILGRGGFGEASTAPGLAVLDAVKAQDVEARAQVINGCIANDQNDAGIVLRYDPVTQDRYTGLLRLTSDNKFSLVIRKQVAGVSQDLVVKDVGYPLGIQTISRFDGRTKKFLGIVQNPNCQADLIFTTQGSELKLKMNLAFALNLRADFDYGGSHEVSFSDPTPLTAGFAGVFIKPGSSNSTSLSLSKGAFATFGAFKATILGTVPAVIFPPNPPALDTNPEGTIPLVPGPRVALIDNSDPIGVVFVNNSTKKWINAGSEGYGFNSNYKLAQVASLDGLLTARYRFSNIRPGKYLVSGSWNGCSGCSRQVPIAIASDLTATKTVRVNQVKTSEGRPDGTAIFQSLAVVEVGAGGFVTVDLTNAESVVIADAFRLSVAP